MSDAWKAEIVTPSQIAADAVDLYFNGLAGGLSTGWAGVDELYTVVPGFWTLVTGYPGSGKSEWVDALCLNLARLHGWRFVYYSPENQPQQLHLAKLIEKYSGKPFFDGPTERLTLDEVTDAACWLQQRFAFIKQAEGPKTIEEILEVCWGWIHKSGRDNPAGIVIDPWNEIDHHRPSALSETEYISKTLTYLRQFARNNECHIWLVAHPKLIQKERESGKRPVPSLSDVSGSAHWWNKADFGIVVHREQGDGSNDVQIHVQKVRFKHMGKQGMAVQIWDRVSGQYRDKVGGPKLTSMKEWRKGA
jgi:twinkle protein